jgi:hypothetical protein
MVFTVSKPDISGLLTSDFRSSGKSGNVMPEQFEKKKLGSGKRYA